MRFISLILENLIPKKHITDRQIVFIDIARIKAIKLLKFIAFSHAFYIFNASPNEKIHALNVVSWGSLVLYFLSSQTAVSPMAKIKLRESPITDNSDDIPKLPYMSLVFVHLFAQY